VSILNKMRRAVKTCWWEGWAIELSLAEEEYREYCEAPDEGRRLDWLRAWERRNPDRVTSEGRPISFTPDSDQEEFRTTQVLRKAAPVQEPVPVDPEDRQDHDAWLAGALARGYEEAGLVAKTDDFSWEWHTQFDSDFAQAQAEAAGQQQSEQGDASGSETGGTGSQQSSPDIGGSGDRGAINAGPDLPGPDFGADLGSGFGGDFGGDFGGF